MSFLRLGSCRTAALLLNLHINKERSPSREVEEDNAPRRRGRPALCSASIRAAANSFIPSAMMRSFHSGSSVRGATRTSQEPGGHLLPPEAPAHLCPLSEPQ